jgi:hypothetical protein
MDMSVGEFAVAAKLSSSRVHALIKQGIVHARKSAGVWLISDAELNRRRSVARPMSPRMAHAFLALLSDDELPPGLEPGERLRLRKRLDYVRGLDDPAPLLSSWLRPRAVLHELSIATDDVEALQKDHRVVLSGISDGRAKLSSAHEVEGYVEGQHFDELCSEYLLVPSSHPNVFLRVSDESKTRPVPLGFVLADLADHNSDREDAQVKRLLTA